MTAFGGWENFYVIVGSSAGALIGLQFVVMTLIADAPAIRSEARAGDAFATPTIVHFAVVLLLSALLSAPWQGMTAVAVLWCLTGLGGIAYSFVVARRMRLQGVYQPVFEDRLFHVLLPLVGYAMLVLAAGVICVDPAAAMFVVAAAVLLLLAVGIHNAWDAVVYNVFVQRRDKGQDERPR